LLRSRSGGLIRS